MKTIYNLFFYLDMLKYLNPSLAFWRKKRKTEQQTSLDLTKIGRTDREAGSSNGTLLTEDLIVRLTEAVAECSVAEASVAEWASPVE